MVHLQLDMDVSHTREQVWSDRLCRTSLCIFMPLYASLCPLKRNCLGQFGCSERTSAEEQFFRYFYLSNGLRLVHFFTKSYEMFNFCSHPRCLSLFAPSLLTDCATFRRYFEYKTCAFAVSIWLSHFFGLVFHFCDSSV